MLGGCRRGDDGQGRGRCICVKRGSVCVEQWVCVRVRGFAEARGRCSQGRGVRRPPCPTSRAGGLGAGLPFSAPGVSFGVSWPPSLLSCG